MMLRIREINTEKEKLTPLSCIDLKEDNISETFKILKFMRDNNIPISISEGVGDNFDNKIYSIEGIYFEVPNIHISEEERCVECITVDVIETYY